MKESVTYQAIVAEGEAKGEVRGRIGEARRLVLRLGRQRLGEPPAGVGKAIEQINDVDRLLEAASCDELLGSG
jgi:predicted transposase YdaD